MATFTININSDEQLQLGVSVITGCGDNSGNNVGIFYENSSSIINGTELFNEELLVTVFVGNPSLLYVGTGVNTTGAVDLTTTTVTNYTFNISALGVVSNLNSCA